jgi:hypothetical protein
MRSSFGVFQMKVYLVTKFVSRNGVVDGFHYSMFHGQETEPCRRLLGRRPQAPLHMWKNVFRMPDVFQPHSEWVVSEAVKRDLERFAGIQFLQAVFTRLFLYPYAARDFSHWRRVEQWGELEKIITDSPHDPRLESTTGPYYEVIVPRQMDVVGQYGDRLRRVEVRTDDPKPVILHLSREMLEEYPFQWERGQVLSEAVYERVKPFLNRDYFDVWEGEM